MEGSVSDTNTLIVSFFSDPAGETYYREAADLLRRRCAELAWPCEVLERPTRSTWLENCNQKPTHILERLEALRRPILWVDVDIDLHHAPVLADRLHEHVDVAAVPYHGPSQLEPPLAIRSTTLFFNATPASLDLVRRWKMMCDASRSDLVGDHRYLDTLVRKNEKKPKFRFTHLPIHYATPRRRVSPETVISIGLARPVKDRRRTMRRVRRSRR